MDWLEEKAEQIKTYIKRASLKRSLFCYLMIMLCSIFVMGVFTQNVCHSWLTVILERYPQITTRYGSLLIFVDGIHGSMKYIVLLLHILYSYCVYIYLILGIYIVTKIFYRKKIRPAKQAIEEALKQITVGDYSHDIIYYSEDELGKLCQGFDQMRKKLIYEKKSQWKQQEEQRKINTVFAHDIRTPLTVIRGYTEFLEKYVPKGKVSTENLLEKLRIMKFQEERLLEFSKTMSRIQKIESFELSCCWIELDNIYQILSECVEGLQKNTEKNIRFIYRHTKEKAFADIRLILEVFENLLGNALRFAHQEIEVELTKKEEKLFIFVKDDGKGFSDKALQRAADIYYTEEENSSEHFGIGLSVCRILCGQHGGKITVRNSVYQGGIVSAEFKI